MQNRRNTVLLTGGTSGIGLALAQRFHAAGNKVIVTGRRSALLDRIASDHPGIIGYVVDITDADAVRTFAAQVVADHPALNVVIHNAGIMMAEDVRGDFLDTAEATIWTNLLGPFRLTAALMPHLLQRPRATIMTGSSGLAFVPPTGTPTYSATKAAIHSWSQSLRTQLRDTGIEVLALAPPAVQTDLMPGHTTDPNAMPLAEFIDEVVGILNQDPTPPLVGVKKVDFLKNAEAEGRYDQIFAQLNGL